jgi:hypothetical protein
MTAIAGDSGYISFACRLALRTAIFLVFTDRTTTRFVRAFVGFICHKLNPPLFVKKIFDAQCDKFDYKRSAVFGQ